MGSTKNNNLAREKNIDNQKEKQCYPMAKNIQSYRDQRTGFLARVLPSCVLLLACLNACGSPTPTTGSVAITTVMPLPTVTPLAKAEISAPAGISTSGQPITVEGIIEQILVSAGGNETVVGINKVQYRIPVVLVTRLGSSLQIGNQLKLEGTRFSDNSIVWTSAAVFSPNPGSVASPAPVANPPAVNTPVSAPLPPVVPPADTGEKGEKGNKDKEKGNEKGKNK